MSFNTANKYLFTLYRRLAIKFDQYLQNVSMITNIDEGKNIFSNNSTTIMGSKKFGIYFCTPCNISELFDGKVGEMTPEHVTAYYGNAIGNEILQNVEHIEFKCDILCNLITYPCHLPQLCEDIPPNTIRSDGLVRIKEVLTYYRDFYQFLAKKYYCFSEKSYEKYCVSECCDNNVNYCFERKNCNWCCERKNCNCQVECRVKCEVECKPKCECSNKSCHKKSHCDCHKKSHCDCHKKSHDCSNNWICRKK
jgi:hypothetical protein